MTRWTLLKAVLIAGGLVAAVLPIYQAAQQATSTVGDALRELDDRTSTDPSEPPTLIADIRDGGSAVGPHRLLGPGTATPRRWVNDARPDKQRPHREPQLDRVG